MRHDDNTIFVLMHLITRCVRTTKIDAARAQAHLHQRMTSTFETSTVIEHVTRNVYHTLAAAFSSAAADPKLCDSDLSRDLPAQSPAAADADFNARAPSPAPQFKEAVINLYASEVGAYIGQGSWLSRTEALGSVWARTNRQQMDQLASLWKTNGCKLPAGTVVPFAQSFDPFPHVRTAADVAAFCSSASQSDILQLYKTKGQLCEEALVARFASSHAQRVMCRHASVTWKSDTDTATPKLVTVRPPGALTDPGLFTITGMTYRIH